MIRVVLESPFAADTPEGIEANIVFARQCVSDCLHRDEAPIASHLLFTQKGILDDTKPEERSLGMRAGFAWNVMAEKCVVYTDRGISRGMKAGIALALKHKIPIEYRTLDEQQTPKPDVVVAFLKEKYNVDMTEDELVDRVDGDSARLREIVTVWTVVHFEFSKELPPLPAWLLKQRDTQST